LKHCETWLLGQLTVEQRKSKKNGEVGVSESLTYKPSKTDMKLVLYLTDRVPQRQIQEKELIGEQPSFDLAGSQD